MSLLKIIQLQKLYKPSYGGNQVEALENINLEIKKGEFVTTMQKSGSSKSILLNIITALDKPTSGKVGLKDMDSSQVKEFKLAELRRDNLGFIFHQLYKSNNINIQIYRKFNEIVTLLSEGEL